MKEKHGWKKAWKWRGREGGGKQCLEIGGGRDVAFAMELEFYCGRQLVLVKSKGDGGYAERYAKEAIAASMAKLD